MVEIWQYSPRAGCGVPSQKSNTELMRVFPKKMHEVTKGALSGLLHQRKGRSHVVRSALLAAIPWRHRSEFCGGDDNEGDLPRALRSLGAFDRWGIIAEVFWRLESRKVRPQ